MKQLPLKFVLKISLEEWSSKSNEAPSLHEMRLPLLDTNRVFLTRRNENDKSMKIKELEVHMISVIK